MTSGASWIHFYEALLSIENRDSDFRQRPDLQYTKVLPYARVQAFLQVKATVSVSFENADSSVVSFVGKVKVAEK